MRIGGFDLNSSVLVVAEIGNNHEGDPQAAKDLVHRAADCGANAVKFQTFRTRHFVAASDRDRFARLSRFELAWSQFVTLREEAHSRGLLFLSTPLDLASAEFLAPLVDAYKVASGDNDFYPLLDLVCRSGKPLILSSGLSDLARISRARQYVVERWTEFRIEQELAVLHCVSAYPVPDQEANLRAILLLRETLGCLVGYSDHTLGIDACLGAVALGARIIEKHFTLDKHRSSFRDHQLSADPSEMAELARRVRRLEAMLGKPEKALQPSEAPNQLLARRSIVAGCNLPVGHRLEWRDLNWMRPATGLRPGQETLVLGKTLRRDLTCGEPITTAEVD